MGNKTPKSGGRGPGDQVSDRVLAWPLGALGSIPRTGENKNKTQNNTEWESQEMDLKEHLKGNLENEFCPALFPN